MYRVICLHKFLPLQLNIFLQLTFILMLCVGHSMVLILKGISMTTCTETDLQWVIQLDGFNHTHQPHLPHSPLLLHLHFGDITLDGLIQCSCLLPWGHRARQGEHYLLPFHHQLCHIGDFDQHTGPRGEVTHTHSEYILCGEWF